MSWIEKLYDTYERCAGAPQFADSPLLPIGHTTQQAHIEIVVDGSGSFRRASVVSRKDHTTLVPCTEESGGRSGTRPVNHPLCDKLQYVAGDFLGYGGEVTSGFDGDPSEPCRAYARRLSDWANSSHGRAKLNAILAYVQQGQVVKDLVAAQVLSLDGQGRLLKQWEGSKDKTPAVFKVIANPGNSFVRWRVEIQQEAASGTWEDRDLVQSWIAYYASRQTKRGMCMVMGGDTVLAEQHPAKLRNAGDKAKLISANDSSGYTYRGRFLEADEACGVGFDVTQKAHNALRWLIDPRRRQAFRNGEQVVVSWAISGKMIPDPFANSFELFAATPVELRLDDYQGDAGQAFGQRFSRLMAGYRTSLGSTDDIVVMALDSATPGRMAITFYRELSGSEFLDRLQGWHEACAWHQDYGRDLDTKSPIRFVGAPSPRDIAEAAFGRRARDKGHRKLVKATVERLLPCIVDGHPLPRDLVESSARRASNPLGQERWEWEKTLGVACALFRGFFEKRRYQMTLETDRITRDYLYGRVLAIAERIEQVALWTAGEERDTNSARLMQRFADRPASTWRSIELALAPYKTRLRARRPGFLRKMEERLDRVIAAFKDEDFMNDGKLSGEFLLGYHCERQALKPGAAARETDREADDSEDQGGTV